ncbi:ABC transporter permease [Rubellimicrobium arenae]|uniref:ABC transporter permease n=1 Tax=Rubellimicrobium arenae TaxID=2817372 RepID=UPI001B30AD9B|nr:ABC transporter permease [Rubellimicrobium arenae]
MTTIVLHRLGQAVLVLWAAFTLSFLLVQMMPGDAVLIRFLDPNMGMTPEDIARIRAFYGSDQPVVQQYVFTAWSFLRGDFGYSVQSGVPVWDEIALNLPPTLTLAGLAVLVAGALAVVLAWAATLSPFGWLRHALGALPAVMISLPVFWIGIMLVQVVSFRLGWVSVIAPGPWERLVLPVLTLALPIAAPLARVLLSSIERIERQAFVTVARAKGLSRQATLWRHVLGNAALPVLAVGGLLLGELVAGAVVTETVFGMNGLGRLAERSVRTQDIAVLQAIVVISALGFVLVNLAVDLVSIVLDPRIRRTREALA